MIPKIVPPLTDLTVLVTRPAPQCAVLCEEIVRQGGSAIPFPAVEIEPIAMGAVAAPVDLDLIVFVSVNAVEHGAARVSKGERTRIAAIGRATAAALAAAELAADIVPDAGFTSEALLAHPQLQLASGARVLIVRGEGGRELLKETFVAQGMAVETLEVYRRMRPQVDAARVAEVEARWSDEGIDVVTVTSIETLENLQAMLTERGRQLLSSTTLLVPSRRIVAAAVGAGLRNDAIVAPGADDASMIGALAQWRMRARAR
ncbi:MAG TPA: uroporphyrinogen-III synthase [Steroidobacteraceae bacterium]|nr:uroporphyrinogen-III synthase [Steroidobacteraceae bacterium]